MVSLVDIVFLLIGILLGAVAAYFYLKSSLTGSIQAQKQLSDSLQTEKDALARQLTDKMQEANELALKLRETETRREADAEQIKRLEELKVTFGDTFKALSGEALKANNTQFLELARTQLEKFQEGAKGDLEKRQQAIDKLMEPIKQSLEKVDEKIHSLEKARVGAYEGMLQQVNHLMKMGQGLQSETANLVKALRAPQVRGRWGEMQLRRAVEAAGMLDHCDFEEQTSTTTDEGALLRPDLLIHLPGGRNVVVDAKAPLAAYIDALEAQTPEEQKRLLAEHARQVKDHLKKLGGKAYWKQFASSPEFVVLFLPGESFFSAALEQDVHLIDYGVDQKVILATPTTLIALLKAIAYGWRQEAIAREAEEICQLGNEIYERMEVFARHLGGIRKGLDSATSSYNSAVSSLESRVLVTARKLGSMRVTADKDIDRLEPANTNLNKPTSAELNEEG